MLAKSRAIKQYRICVDPEFPIALGGSNKWKDLDGAKFGTKNPFNQARLEHLRERLETYCQKKYKIDFTQPPPRNLDRPKTDEFYVPDL